MFFLAPQVTLHNIYLFNLALSNSRVIKHLHGLTKSAKLSLKGDSRAKHINRGSSSRHPQGQISPEKIDVRFRILPGMADQPAIKRGMLDNRQGFPGPEGTMQDRAESIQQSLQTFSDIPNQEGCAQNQGIDTPHSQGYSGRNVCRGSGLYTYPSTM